MGYEVGKRKILLCFYSTVDKQVVSKCITPTNF
jgi:hypothetical protein